MSRSPVFIAKSHADASEQEDALPGWDQRYVQIGGGRFEGATAFLDFGRVAIGEERLNVEVAQSTSPPRGKLAVIVHSEQVRSRINGQAQSSQVFLHRGGHQIDVAGGTADTCGYYLVVDESALPAVDLRALPAIGPVDIQERRGELADWCSSVIAAAPESLRLAPGALEKVLPAMVVDRVLEVCGQFGSHGRTLRQSYANSVFRRARKRVDDLSDQNLSVASLSLELSVPEHILRNAFIESTGLSPRVWMRQERLNRARRAMLRPDGQPKTVAHIAMEAGFFHLGRFAAYYADTFHETPIETIRNSLTL
jgi:AraC family ethanolamine operon transcriptional activator